MAWLVIPATFILIGGTIVVILAPFVFLYGFFADDIRQKQKFFLKKQIAKQNKLYSSDERPPNSTNES